MDGIHQQSKHSFFSQALILGGVLLALHQTQQVSAFSCLSCESERAVCGLIPDCPHSLASEPCGCCWTCAKQSEGRYCGRDYGAVCDKGLVCRSSTSHRVNLGGLLGWVDMSQRIPEGVCLGEQYGIVSFLNLNSRVKPEMRITVQGRGKGRRRDGIGAQNPGSLLLVRGCIH